MSTELLFGIIIGIALINVGVFIYRVRLAIKNRALFPFEKNSHHMAGLVLYGSILLILLLAIILISPYLLK
jgi:hypothetical protein